MYSFQLGAKSLLIADYIDWFVKFEPGNFISCCSDLHGGAQKKCNQIPSLHTMLRYGHEIQSLGLGRWDDRAPKCLISSKMKAHKWFNFWGIAGTSFPFIDAIPERIHFSGIFLRIHGVSSCLNESTCCAFMLL